MSYQSENLPMKENTMELTYAGEGAPALSMTLADMTQLSRAVAASKLFGMQSPEQALVLMALCQSEGKNPIQAVRQYHIINGKPAMRADAMLAEFQARGGKVSWGERTNASVSGTFSHPAGGEITVTWTLKDAQEAGLTGNPTWKKFPRQMLTARVISEAIRTILPGVVAGIYTPEEIQDIPAPSMPRPMRSSEASLRAIAPELEPQSSVHEVAALPEPPPSRTPPIERFIAFAQGLTLTTPAITGEGKISKKGCLALLSECYGQEVAELSEPTDHAAWEGHLAAVMAIYGEPSSDPFEEGV